MSNQNWKNLNKEIISCKKCKRLVAFRKSVAKKKTKRFENWNYWGMPVTGYGNIKANLVIVGLAPAAHGGNRTGRVFTGDKSADFLISCLYRAKLSNQPTSISKNDGLKLINSYMTPVLKCVPPQDKPKTNELISCFHFFERELRMLNKTKIILALGKIAFDACLSFYKEDFPIKNKDYVFSHGVKFRLPDNKILVGSYHPSPRNVNTRRIDFSKMVLLLEEVKKILKNKKW